MPSQKTYEINLKNFIFFYLKLLSKCSSVDEQLIVYATKSSSFFTQIFNARKKFGLGIQLYEKLLTFAMNFQQKK